MTVKGQALLRRSDVVVYDHLVSPRILAECPPTARRLYVGKEVDGCATSQPAINRLLIRRARAGKTVIRLKGGDPFVFGRGGEEALALARAGVAYEVVPGVTSAVAVPAYAGIPLTHRDHASSIAIITGHEDPAKPQSAIRWQRLATACDTLVCLMGVKTLPRIARQLMRHGRSQTTPCAVIEWGTWPRQRTLTGPLRTIAAQAARASIKPPAILIVGEVVSLRHRLNWFERKPLFGKRILITRAAEKAEPLAERLEALGAEVEQLPAIELIPAKSNGLFREAVNDLPNTDWVFFTSPEGIGWFARMLKPYRKDVQWLSGCHIAAIGPKTAAAIEAAGLRVDFIPKQFSQEGILEDLPSTLIAGKRALIFSAAQSREALEQGLRQRGMAVKKVPIYRTVRPRALSRGMARAARQRFDFVTVTSASCVEHVFQALKRAGMAGQFSRWRFASIGPVTSRAIRSHGGRVAVEAKASTIEGLVEAMTAHTVRERNG